MPSSMRKAVTLAAALLALASIGLSLWRADWRYSLPTPRPPGLVQPECVEPALLARLRAAAGPAAEAQPLLVHFAKRQKLSKADLEALRKILEEKGNS